MNFSFPNNYGKGKFKLTFVQNNFLMQYSKIFLFTIMFTGLFISCDNQKAETETVTTPEEVKLGEINFPVTGAVAAQPYFKKGLLLLHSFEYDDAREAFLEAQEIDSTFAMTYWGEAMTYNHSLWQKQEKEKAIAALEKLGADSETRAALIQTPIEKDFFQAIEILFGEGTKYERDVAYKNYMEELAKKYPDNHEVAAFYAISLLGSSRNGRDEELYGKSARIVQGIIKENPGHPGALHYLIHSYDDPVHAHLAKTAADSYSKVAPDAAHALHMPSHIYVALGKWNDVVTSNIASWNASIKRLERKEIDDKNGSYHAYNWLQYGLLQRGEVDLAADLLTKMQDYTDENSEKQARRYLIAMKGAYLVETNDWTSDLANIEIKTADLPITSRTGYAFLEGMKFYHQNEADSLRKVIAAIQKDRLKSKAMVGEKGFAMCSAGGYANKPPNQLDIDMVEVMEMELSAYLAAMKGDFATTNDWFEKATALDEDLNYSFGPPTILKPVHEAYGEWLLTQKQPEAALVIFEQSLERHPRRLLSLQGKKQAAALLNKDVIVKEVEEEIAVSLEKKGRGVVL